MRCHSGCKRQDSSTVTANGCGKSWSNGRRGSAIRCSSGSIPLACLASECCERTWKTHQTTALRASPETVQRSTIFCSLRYLNLPVLEGRIVSDKQDLMSNGPGPSGLQPCVLNSIVYSLSNLCLLQFFTIDLLPSVCSISNCTIQSSLN